MPSDHETTSARLRRARADGPTKPDLPGLNRPASVGRMGLLRRPVVLYDPMSNIAEVIACNDVGAIVAVAPGSPQEKPPHGAWQLRLGCRERGQNHFFLVDVLEAEEVTHDGAATRTHLTVRWNAFAGSSAGATSEFAATHLKLNLHAHRVQLTRPAPEPRLTPGDGPDCARSGAHQGAQGAVAQLSATGGGTHIANLSGRSHSYKRRKTPISNSLPRSPLTIPRTAMPALALRAASPAPRRQAKPVTKPAQAPKMPASAPTLTLDPTTEERLLRGRRPIPLGPGK